MQRNRCSRDMLIGETVNVRVLAGRDNAVFVMQVLTVKLATGSVGEKFLPRRLEHC